MVGILVTAVSGLASAMFSKSSISAEPGARSSSSFYDITLPDLNNEQIPPDKFKGKKLLIVNVASRCGYPSPHKKLQELYARHSDNPHHGAVPCNDFKNQPHVAAEQIKNF
jgi:Glutathione peroxidase